MKDSFKETIKKRNIKRNRAFFNLMIKSPRVQEGMAKWRKKLDIPEGGFADQESCSSYFRKKEREFKNIKVDKETAFKNKLFGKFGFHFKKEIHDLIYYCGFTYGLEDAVGYYLLSNEISGDDSHFLCLPYANEYKDEFSGANIKLCIIIDDFTTIEEVKLAWPRIMELQRDRKLLRPIRQFKKIDSEDIYKTLDSYKRKPQFKELKNIKRDELIIRLKKQGLSGKEIKDKVREMGHGVIGYEYVPQLIKRYNSKLGIRKA